MGLPAKLATALKSTFATGEVDPYRALVTASRNARHGLHHVTLAPAVSSWLWESEDEAH